MSDPGFEVNAGFFTAKMQFAEFIAAIRSARTNDLIPNP